jgi:transcriptional regulator with XRE-family HTH domain
MTTKSTGPIDKLIGERMRMRRIAIGMSQEKLGDALGLTFQQVQKYEKGMNRISVGRLQSIADILRVPVTFFFDPQKAFPNQGTPDLHEFLISKDGLELASAFLKIENPAMRRALINMAQAAANTP